MNNATLYPPSLRRRYAGEAAYSVGLEDGTASLAAGSGHGSPMQQSVNLSCVSARRGHPWVYALDGFKVDRQRSQSSSPMTGSRNQSPETTHRSWGSAVSSSMTSLPALTKRIRGETPNSRRIQGFRMKQGVQEPLVPAPAADGVAATSSRSSSTPSWKATRRATIALRLAANPPVPPQGPTARPLVVADSEDGGERKQSPAPLLVRWPKYEEACQQRAILPKFARAAHEGLLGADVELSSQGLGDLQLEALLCDDMLLPVARLRRWRLRDTRLSSMGCAALAAKLPEHTEMLNLAVNDIGLRGVEALSGLMFNAHLAQLRRLDLSANGLRNDAVAMVAMGLTECPALLRLDLNHNAFDDGSALGRLIANHAHMMRLSLHCNFLSGGGSAALFQGLLENSQNGGRLADVDVAWNGIGDEKGADAASAISAVLRESVALYHLDLSYNSLDPRACAIIAEGLRDNHHLYGLHFVGNAATMDAHGFLQPFPEGSLSLPLSPRRGRPSPLSFGDPRNGTSARVGDGRQCNNERIASRAGTASQMAWSDDDVLRDRDVLEHQTTCWACEGWERVELAWPIDPDEPEPKAVWAFTSLDGFRAGTRLPRAAGGQPRFCIAKMVPASCRLLVIFQVDAALCVAPGLEVQKLEAAAEIELRACTDLPELQPPADQDIALHRQSSCRSAGGGVEHRYVLRLACANAVGCCSRVRPLTQCNDMVGRRTVLLDGPGGAGPVQMPRVTDAEFRMKTTRLRSKPFFAGFKRDSDAIMKECFRLDWSRAKVGRLVEEREREEVQNMLQSNYQKLLAIYRVISAMGVTGATGFGVTQIEVSDTVQGAGLLDSTTRIADVDRLFIAAKVMQVDMKRGLAVRQDKSLVRHQFLEFLLRLADQRYVQTHVTGSISEALGLVLEALSRTGDAKVAETDAFFAALHTEEVDDVYKRHTKNLQVMYQKFSGRFTPPGLAKFMSLSEFQGLLELINAYDTEFTTRRSAVAFRMGMMTQPEESFCSRFQEMTFIEFQHALGAVVFLRANFDSIRMAELVDDFFSNNLVLALHSKPEST